MLTPRKVAISRCNRYRLLVRRFLPSSELNIYLPVGVRASRSMHLLM